MSTNHQMEAIGEHVIVKILDGEEVTRGGIVIPSNAQQPPQVYGKVLSVGDEVSSRKIELKPDDVIMFHQQGGQIILVEETQYRVLKVDEVYGKVQKGEN